MRTRTDWAIAFAIALPITLPLSLALLYLVFG